MRPEEREKLLVDGAIEYFSEVGFGGDTRELAKRVGVTQSLLFKYFGHKDALVERVYDEVFFRKWDTGWSPLIRNRSLSLRERMVTFYVEYARIFLDRKWIRIFMYAGLEGTDFNNRFLSFVQSAVLDPLCEELRDHFRLHSAERLAISRLEKELVMGLHGQIAYLAIRKWIYSYQVNLESTEAIIGAAVDVFLAGAEHVIKVELQGDGEPVKRGSGRARQAP